LDDKLYVVGETVKAYNIENGNKMWEFSLDSAEVAYPALGCGIIIVQTNTALRALDRSSGEQLWRTDDTASLSEGHCAYVDGKFYISSEGYICAINADSGTKQWETDIGIGTSGVSVGPNRVYAGAGANNSEATYALDKNDGDVAWQQSDVSSYVLPSLGDEYVYINDRESRIIGALEPKSGAMKWKYELDSGVKTTPPAYDPWRGSVYLPTGTEGSIIALSAATGSKKWKKNIGNFVSNPVVVLQDGLYVGTNSLYSLSPRTGNIRWEVDAGITSPFACDTDGNIYMNANGDIGVFDLASV
jgi:outer membrane protein assembly factor BamB